MSDEMEKRLQLLLDREAIRDVIMRYCYGADRGEESVLRSVYWPDATDDHGVFSGTASDYIAFLLKTAGTMDQMQHLVGNMLIRTSGTTARCESYFIGYHRMKDERGRPFDSLACGRYLDELEKREAEWRIIRRKVVFDWFRNFDDSADWSRGFNGTGIPMGGRVPGDPSVAHFHECRLDQPAFRDE
jgi:hypothetical protein